MHQNRSHTAGRGLLAMTVVGLALGLLLVGASSASVASKAQQRAGNPVVNIDYANFSDGSAFLKDFGQGFVNAAKVAGYKMKYYNNNLDGPTAIRNAPSARGSENTMTIRRRLLGIDGSTFLTAVYADWRSVALT